MPLRGPKSRRHSPPKGADGSDASPKWTPGAHFVTRLVNGRYVSTEVRPPAEAPPPAPSEEAATEASDAAPPPAEKGTKKTKRKYEKRSPYWNDANKHLRQRKADTAAPRPRPEEKEEVAEKKGPAARRTGRSRKPAAVFGQVTSWKEADRALRPPVFPLTPDAEQALDVRRAPFALPPELLEMAGEKEKRKRKKKAETGDAPPKQELRRKKIGRFGRKKEEDKKPAVRARADAPMDVDPAAPAERAEPNPGGEAPAGAGPSTCAGPLRKDKEAQETKPAEPAEPSPEASAGRKAAPGGDAARTARKGRRRGARVVAETDDEGDDECADGGTDVQPAGVTELVPVVLPWVTFLDKDGLSRKWEAKVGQHYAGLYSIQADAFLASAQLAMHAAASRGAGAGAAAGGSAGLKAQLLAGPEGAELRAASTGPMRDVVDHLLGLALEQLCNRAGFEKLDVAQFAKRLRIEARGGTRRYPYVEAVDARVQEPERKWKASVELPDPRPGQGQRTLRFELGRYKNEVGGANVAAVFMAHVLATGFPDDCNSAAAFRKLVLKSHYVKSCLAPEDTAPYGKILEKMWDHYNSSKVPAEYRDMSVLEFAKEMNFTFRVV